MRPKLGTALPQLVPKYLSSHISGLVQGCFSVNSSLPYFGPAPLVPSPLCIMQDADSVSACMCTTSGCNGGNYRIKRPTPKLRIPRDAESREPKNFIFPFANSSTVTKTESREGRQKRLKCFSCGSLFNRDSPPCARFDPADQAQVMTCNEGEACMLYTWNKSRTEIGEAIIAQFLFNRYNHRLL